MEFLSKLLIYSSKVVQFIINIFGIAKSKILTCSIPVYTLLRSYLHAEKETVIKLKGDIP